FPYTTLFRSGSIGTGRGSGDTVSLTVRPQPAVRLRRHVPVRGRRAAGRATCRGVVGGFGPVGRAARHRGHSGTARRRCRRRDGTLVATAHSRTARPRGRGDGRPVAFPRRPDQIGGG